MSRENVEIVRRIYGLWAAGDFSGGDHFDPHVTFVVRPPFPETAVVVGPDAITGYMRGFLEQWERISFEATRLRVVGDTVLADVIQRGRGRASGTEVEAPMFTLFTFRAGKILRIESVVAEAEALEAVGLSE